jgi:hypothetical protein
VLEKKLEQFPGVIAPFVVTVPPDADPCADAKGTAAPITNPANRIKVAAA